MTEETKNKGCIPLAIIGTIAFVIIGYTCNRVGENMEKLDGFTQTILGLVVLGGVLYFMYTNTKGK